MSAKQELARKVKQIETLTRLGFYDDEIPKLIKISKTLRRWFEKECGIDGYAIGRDSETGKPYKVYSQSGRRFLTADLETAARKRLAKIMLDRNARSSDVLTTYIQGDPRGAALYILRPGDIPDGYKPQECYNRGIVVY